MKKFALELKWGLIFSLASLVWMVIEKLSGLHGPHIDQHMIYTNLFFFVAIAAYALAYRERKLKTPSDFGFVTAMVYGLGITVIVAMLSPFGQVVTHYLISPEYFPNVIAYSVTNNLMTQEAAEQYFSLENYIVQSIIGALAAGLVTSLVMALVYRNRPKASKETAISKS